MPDESGEPRPPRAFWSGTLAFGLVTVPVELLPAVRSERTSLRMLAPDGTPLSRQYWCPREERLLDPVEIVRGYEVDDGEFVVVTDEELDALEPEKSREIDLRRFVPEEAIDPIFFERGYFLAPSGASSKAYRLLAGAMARAGRAGIGTFVMRGTEHVAAIFSEDGILRLETLRFTGEVRSPDDVGLPEPGAPPEDRTERFGEAIDALAADSLNPAELDDPYAERLDALVAAKLAGGEDVVEPPPGEPAAPGGDAEIVDLMEVLKRRLKGGAEPAPARRRAVPSREDLEGRTKKELYDLARELDVEGRSSMTKAELVRAIRRTA